jgi:hypothetical protein
MSTGDEVEEPTTENLPKGKVRDVNRIMLLTALEEVGARALDMGIARDSEANVEMSSTRPSCKMQTSSFLREVCQWATRTLSREFCPERHRPFWENLYETRQTVHICHDCTRGKDCSILWASWKSRISSHHISSLCVPCIKVLQGIREDKLRIVAYACTTSDIKIDPSRTEFRRVNVQFQAETGKAGAGRLVAHDIMAVRHHQG